MGLDIGYRLKDVRVRRGLSKLSTFKVDNSLTMFLQLKN